MPRSVGFPWVPRLLALHLGVSMLALAATGAFLTPGVSDLTGAGGTTLLLLEAAVGVWLVSGYQVRSAAVLVLALGPVLAVAASSATILLECANLAAAAAFLVAVPPGTDRFGFARPSDHALRWGLFWMRVGVGVALIALAFTEKFTYPALALKTLESYPALNVFSLVRIPVGDETFVAIAGAVELLFGLLVISGAALRPDRAGRSPAGVRRLPGAAGLRLQPRHRRPGPVVAAPPGSGELERREEQAQGRRVSRSSGSTRGPV